MNRLAHLVLALALLPLVAGCHQSETAASAEPSVGPDRVTFGRGAPQLAMLATEPVQRGADLHAPLFARLAWDDDATVRVFTPFAGRVRHVLVDAGQVVTKGTPLAEVESPDFGQAQADARTAESDLQLAGSTLARLRELFDHGAAARKDVEAAEADLDRAQAQRARARARLASCGAETDSVTGLFLLRSPIAGTIVERNLTPGQEIRPDQMLANAPQLFSPLFVLSDPSRLWIQIDAHEDEIASLHPGTPFRFTVEAAPGRSFAGRIDIVSESIDPGTHTVRARGTVENPEHLLKAEMYVSVDLQRRAEALATVSSRAVFLRGEKHYAFVEEHPGTFVRHEVSVGGEQDQRVLVQAGLRPGQRVVTDGSLLLQQLLD
jgi:cobalt-zinc-cadmium efflux system membrane fusion protein